MAIKKKFLKTKPVCKVTFEMQTEQAGQAKNIFLAGDFNNWDTQAAQMTKLKNGTFKITLDLQTGKEYQYKYFIDGQRWENDSQADKYLPSGVGGENSVLILD